jgi:wyosine [tRNA(Phe)-imidazoG37] synthetase (radical SAM superfamily)
MSLGISLTPYKICNFDCTYCQLGRTKELTCERKEYIKIENIVAELRSWLQNNVEEAKNLNYITISGSGEPTLNIKIGELIKEIKAITNIAVAVITNASLLNAIEVRQALLNSDLVLPSLDSVITEVFNKINRPHQNIKIEEIINGLVNFKKEFRGKIWLEVMLVRSVNDDLRQVKKMKEVIERINPDKIQLNSPIRTTAEPDVLAVDKNKLEKIKEILGDKCEII